MAVGNQAEMPFLDHLEELRWRILWSLVALAVGFGLAWWVIVKFEVLLAFQRHIETYLEGRRLVYTHPADPFRITMSASLALGTIFALPVIVYQLWSFLAPALYKHEKRVAIPVFAFGSVLFLCGVALSYFIILPLTLGFLYRIQQTGLDPMISYREYYDFAINMSLALGAIFELPIVILALSALGIVTPQMLVRMRRHAFVICLVGGAFITPGGDPFSLALLSAPLYLLYEFSVLVSAFVFRWRQRREARS